jgi:hypothetical protein
MPSILLIQFRHNPIAADLERSSIARELAGRASVEARSVFTEFDDIERLVHLIDGVILGGSGDLDFDGARTVSDPVRIEAKHILKQYTRYTDAWYLFWTPVNCRLPWGDSTP